MPEPEDKGAGVAVTGAEESLSILVAEDDVTLGQALTAFLRENGHQVDFAQDGRQALAFISQKNYALVITDLVMPGADGLEVLKSARQRNPATLVVIMTGYASTDSAIQAIREGAYDYLRKPFNLQEINIAVANAARLLRLHRENQQLLRKLNSLTTELENLQRARQNSRSIAADQEQSQGLSVSSVLSNTEPSGHEPVPQSQADLERLYNLYRQNLLTDKEYQVLKQRLHI